MSEVKKIATRESYGNALVEIGKEHEDLVVLDADLAGDQPVVAGGKGDAVGGLHEQEIRGAVAQGRGLVRRPDGERRQRRDRREGEKAGAARQQDAPPGDAR